MYVAVYLPLVLPLLAAVSAGRLAARFDPRMATWLLTAASIGLAAASGFALTALAATAVGQIPLLAALGDWSVRVLHQDDPTSLTLASLACVLLSVALAAAGRALVRRARALIDAARTARGLPVVDGDDRVVVLDDPVPDAYALPGAPGRIVVSTGMLDAFDEPERQALLAHERAHLAYGHHVFVSLAHLAASTNPLLRPLATAVKYSTERWADEHAAGVTGDRRLVARTLAKAALLTRHHGGEAAGALGIASGLTGRRRGPGPVPRRVAALLAGPPRRHRVLLALALGVLAVAVLSSIEAARDLETLFELAQAAS